MVECTTYADDIKYHGGAYQSQWHFLNIPYYDDPGSKPSDYKFKAPTHNITEAMDGIVAWLNKKGSYKNSYIYKSIMNDNHVKGNEHLGLSTALRFLIHFVGDIH